MHNVSLNVSDLLSLVPEPYRPDDSLPNSYNQMIDLLRQNTDSRFGVESKLVGNEWVRDATRATPLEERIPHDHPDIEVNNALMRCLARVNSIDYAIGKKYPGVVCLAIRKDLNEKLKQLILDIYKFEVITDAEKRKKIKHCEAQFNTYLLEKLHEANLTKGCTTAQDGEKLLEHFRNLSSLLVPARTLVTITYDDKNFALNRETQYPVTELTDSQIEEIKKLRVPKFSGVENTAHNPSNLASMEADSLFVDLMLKGDRAMPAQTRKSHVVLAKNAFIVKNEVAFGVGNKPSDPTIWLARSGSPVYVGKGKSEEFIQHHTQEILEQIRLCAKKHMGKSKLSLHVASLVTDISVQNEHRIVSHIRDATRAKKGGDDYSYMPLNLIGTLSPLSIADRVKSKPSGITPLEKASRLDSAVSVIVKEAIKGGDQIVLVHCASGQDRTGTAVEKAKQQILNFLYKKRYEIIDEKNIEIVSAQGGNAAEIASHLSPGSPGMKAQSRANNFFLGRRTFSREVEKELYLDSANTNKKSKVLDVSFLSKPSQMAINEFIANKNKYFSTLEGLDKFSNMYISGKNLLEKITNITRIHPNSLDRTTIAKLGSINLANLSSVLEIGEKVLQQPNIENINELIALTENIHHKSKSLWRQTASYIIKVAACALPIAAILAAPYTLGLSLILIPLTPLLWKASKDIREPEIKAKDLVKVSNEFKSSLLDIKKSEEDPATPLEDPATPLPPASTI